MSADPNIISCPDCESEMFIAFDKPEAWCPQCGREVKLDNQIT